MVLSTNWRRYASFKRRLLRTLRRARNWDVRGVHVVRRALVEKNRATTGQRRKRTRRFEDACFTEFLYATSPKPMFRLILSFL